VGGDPSPVSEKTPSAAIGGASAYISAVIVGVDGIGPATGSGLNGSGVGVPMPAEAAGVEVVEPVVDVDEPVLTTIDVGLIVVDVGLVIVDVGLIVVDVELIVVDVELDVADIDPPAGLVAVDVDVGPEVNVRERLIPGGTCETLPDVSIMRAEPDPTRTSADEIVELPLAVAEADGLPLTLITFIEAPADARC
jgi:hypothetical protein